MFDPSTAPTTTDPRTQTAAKASRVDTTRSARDFASRPYPGKGKLCVSCGAPIDGRNPEQIPKSALEEELMRVDKTIAALQSRRMVLIAALSRTTAARDSGATSIEDYLAQTEKISKRSAKEAVELAEALRPLTEVSKAVESGELSLEVAREVTKFATPETQTEIVDKAISWSPEKARYEARRAQQDLEAKTERAEDARYLKWWWDRDGVGLKIDGYLPAESGGQLIAAIDAVAAREIKTSLGYLDWSQARADALVELIQSSGPAGPTRPVTRLNLHISLGDLLDLRGALQIGADGFASSRVARKIACDASVRAVIERSNGEIAGAGREMRVVSKKLADLITHRDRTCIFPGCMRPIAHIHHIVHWADGGKTDPDNCVGLCRYHHSLVHRGDWKMIGSASETLKFIRPDGRELIARERPPPTGTSSA